MTDPEQIINAEADGPKLDDIPGEHRVGGRPGYTVLVQLIDTETNGVIGGSTERYSVRDLGHEQTLRARVAQQAVDAVDAAGLS